MSEEITAPPVEDFDIVDWLNDSINAESTITVYRDGTRLYQLEELSALAANAAERAKNADAAGLSIADEFDEAATEAIASAEKLRKELAPSGVTFRLRSIGTESRDVLYKALARESRFKGTPKSGDVEAIPGGDKHPDFFGAFQDVLIARAVVDVTTADDRKDARQWTAERVNALRKLPLREFDRLWNKVHDLHYKQYDIERMIDLDFSSRH